MVEKDEKGVEKQLEEQKPLTSREEMFCELVASGETPQNAHILSRYSLKTITSGPYKRLQREEIKERIANLIDKSLPKIVKNDIALAKLQAHKGEHILENGKEIPPSMIEGAKNRIYDRSSLGPVIRQSRNENLNLNANIQLTQEQERELDSALASYYGNMNERNTPIDVTPQS